MLSKAEQATPTRKVSRSPKPLPTQPTQPNASNIHSSQNIAAHSRDNIRHSNQFSDASSNQIEITDDLPTFDPEDKAQHIDLLYKYVLLDSQLDLQADRIKIKAYFQAFYGFNYNQTSAPIYPSGAGYETPVAIKCRDLLFSAINTGANKKGEHPLLKELLGLIMVFGRAGVDKPVQKEDKLEYIPQMLSRVRPTETIQEMATRSLINYSMNEENRQTIIENDGINLILHGMRLYSGSETIQLVSVWALRHLSITPQVAPLLVAAQGIAEISFALSEFPQNSLLAEQGCHLLLNLATLESGVKTLCQAAQMDSEGGGGRTTESGAEGAGIRLVLDILKDHIEARKVVDPILTLIKRLMKHKEAETLLRKGDTVETLSNVRNHWNSVPIDNDPNGRIQKVRTRCEDLLALLAAEPRPLSPKKDGSPNSKVNGAMKASAKDLDSTTVMREGWLFKDGGLLSGPAKRYFRLFKDRLEYSKSQTEKCKVLFSKDMRSCCHEAKTSKIAIVYANKKLHVTAFNIPDALDWAGKIIANSPDSVRNIKAAANTNTTPRNALHGDSTKPNESRLDEDEFSPLADFTMSFTPFVEKITAFEIAAMSLYEVHHQIEPSISDIAQKAGLPRELVHAFFTRVLCARISKQLGALQVGKRPGTYDHTLFRALCTNIEMWFLEDAERIDLRKEFESKSYAQRPKGYLSCRQGSRPEMEDRHMLLPYTDVVFSKQTAAISFFGIFDGHGGPNCAEYVASMLVDVLFSQENSFQSDVKKSLQGAFSKTNEMYKDASERLQWPSKLGSTAVTCCIKDKKAWFAWAGDSSAIVFWKDGRSKTIVDPPHKPSVASEQSRIERLGGYVTVENGYSRVNGRLGVTRSFGDTRFSCVNAEPDIREMNLNGSEWCIVMACDGLWDVLDEKAVGNILKAHIAKGEKLSSVSEVLVAEALRLGSTDNVSVILIDLVDIN